MKFLAVSGSLRAASSSSRLVRALALLAPDGVRVEVWDGLAELPHFNPDLDEEGMTPPPAVASLRAALGGADALIVSSPEYAHGVPGSLKNALDWLVSGPEMIEKPVAVIGASPRAVFARAQLIETLRTMSARVIEEACVSVSLAGKVETDERTIATHPSIATPLRAALALLARSARTSA